MNPTIAFIILLDVLFFGLSFYFLAKERRVRKKKNLLKGILPAAGSAFPDAFSSKGEPGPGALEAVMNRLIDFSSLKMLLLSADVSFSLVRFFTLSLAVGILCLIPVYLFAENLYAGLVVFSGGLFLPWAVLVHRRKKREETLVKQLPDMLDVMVRALKIGQSVDGALREISRSFPSPVGTEVRMIYEEISMGLPFETALHNFEYRFPHVPDVKILCTAFIIQRETGGNLISLLEGLSTTIRERFQLRRQVRTLTAESRSSATILGLLPLGFTAIIWIFNPQYIQVLLNHPIGKKLLCLAIFLIAAGFITMRLMTRIEI
jgi:tight adherence protein B